jgi:glycosyltransferase involved in cell wall biosynthesis
MDYANELSLPLGDVSVARAPVARSALCKPGSISVIFPAYNEEANIEKSVAMAREAMGKFFETIEIIVVNDGSADRTGEILDRMAAEASDVQCIHFEKNSGYGAALRTGLYAAKNDLVFFSDSDLQFDLEEIRHLLEWIDHYEIVAGYRAQRADPPVRRFNAWGWKTLVRMVLGLKVRDIDCAFKLFRREVFDAVKLSSVGAMINTELLVRAQQEGMRIKEVPVSHYPRKAGKQTGSNLRVILKAFRELLEMRSRLQVR